MNKDVLNNLIKSFMTCRFDHIDPIQTAKDFNLDHEIHHDIYGVIDALFLKTLRDSYEEISIHQPECQDDLFDLILTFFEKLNAYKAPLKEILFFQIGAAYPVLLFKVLHNITYAIFRPYIITSLDQWTYSICFYKLFYTWLMDTTQDLSFTSHQINRMSTIIFSKN